MPTATELEQVLRGASLRVTRPRVAVLGAVYDHPHADTDAIVGVVRAGLGEVALLASLPGPLPERGSTGRIG